MEAIGVSTPAIDLLDICTSLVTVLVAGAAAVVALVATFAPDDAAQYRCGSEAGAD